MNPYLQSVIFGIVEGLTEFLPVSSTAHIRIAQKLLGINGHDPYWKMYSVVIQLGAILSVLVYFWRRIIDFIKSFPRGSDGTKTIWTHPLSLVVLAFVITAGPCLYFDKKIGDNLESFRVMGIALIVGGIAMWVIDAVCRRPRTMDMNQMSFAQAVTIGFFQIFAAMFPGTSRSMSTIAAGQIMGLSRTVALEFSFFLSIPVMFAATGLKLGQTAMASVKGTLSFEMGTQQWGVLAVGFVVSFFVALACSHFFMAWVRKHGFVPFAIYRILAGAAVLFWLV